MKHASDFDPAMRVQEDDLQDMRWLHPADEPIRLQGLGWKNNTPRYRRLPPNTAGDLPEAVDYLATNAAGIQVQFKSTSKRIGIAVELAKAAGSVHMPATGQGGCDLYVKQGNEFLYYHTSKYNPKCTTYNLLMFEDPEPCEREFLINFPLYEEVTSLHIGVDHEAQVSGPSAFAIDKPIIIYGTSITQGGCASRPGMATSNILSRRLNTEFINLGFSGSGKGEPALAHYINQITDPALIILDYEANTHGVGISKTLPKFVDILRSKQSNTPLLIISAPPNTKAAHKPSLQQRIQSDIDWQQQFVAERRQNGDQHIYFLDGSSALATQFQEATVDGTHPTDLGFLLMADHWEDRLRQILSMS